MKIELHIAGFNSLRKDPNVLDELERRAEQIRDAANATLDEGEGYELEEREQSRARGRFTIYPDTPHARASNNKNLTLVKVMDAGRG